MTKAEKTVLGRMTWVDFFDDQIHHVFAKVDTGADLSSVWASNISVDHDGYLHFTLFDKNSEFYTGRVITKKSFKVTLVRSSNGHEQIRYTVQLKVKIGGRLIRATFTLTDRSKNRFPILIGSKLLRNKFIVDVSEEYEKYRKMVKTMKTDDVKGSLYMSKLSDENPKKFFDTHYVDHSRKETA